MPRTPTSRLNNLKADLKQMRSVLIAYSGGTDSVFLAKTARDTLKDNATAITAASPMYPQKELKEAKQLAKKIGIRHIIIDTGKTQLSSIKKNTENRCYDCKKELFKKLKEIASKNNIPYVLDATNLDDLTDYRPGIKALRELNIKSPLVDAKLTKKDIRHLSKNMGLDTWDKPSSACLASRIPYGTQITKKHLEQIEKSENIIKKLGIKQLRIRHHGTTAIIEVLKKDIPILLKHSKKITRKLKQLGFTYITIDLEGYRQGSLNEVLKNETDAKRL